MMCDWDSYRTRNNLEEEMNEIAHECPPTSPDIPKEPRFSMEDVRQLLARILAEQLKQVVGVVCQRDIGDYLATELIECLGTGMHRAALAADCLAAYPYEKVSGSNHSLTTIDRAVGAFIGQIRKEHGEAEIRGAGGW